MNAHATRAVPGMGKALHDAATINALVSSTVRLTAGEFHRRDMQRCVR
jgi:hypothetical protein